MESIHNFLCFALYAVKIVMLIFSVVTNESFLNHQIITTHNYTMFMLVILHIQIFQTGMKHHIKVLQAEQHMHENVCSLQLT